MEINGVTSLLGVNIYDNLRLKPVENAKKLLTHRLAADRIESERIDLKQGELLNASHQPQVDCADHQITSTLLHRINPARDEKRFYFVMVGASLFDPHAVVRVWGRIGGHQQVMITPCPNTVEARALATSLIRRRLTRGYKIIRGVIPTNNRLSRGG